MQVKKQSVIFIVGPTATGKTAIALKLAKKIKGEIISCDSMQVYKRMDILSQAPLAKETAAAPYHLIKVLSPAKEFSAAIFVKRAGRLIKDIIKRKRIPIIAGGTGLYVKALIDGLFPSPEADPVFRKKMYAYAQKYGSGYLYKKLQKADREAAGKMHRNDTRRIVRALEVLHSTGKTMTELKKNTKGILGIYDVRIFGLTARRDHMYSNINDRVDRMIKAGAVKEVYKLRKKDISKTARSVIGLKELAGYIDGEYGLEEATELMKRNTRRYAKRQLTWFRADKRIRWFDISSLRANEVSEAILKEIASPATAAMAGSQ
jgi:tRNA dimethylallyltransferase